MSSATPKGDGLAVKLLRESLPGFFIQIGEVFFLLFNSILRIPKLARNYPEAMKQMHAIGVTSLPLVLGISVFTGAIALWQARYEFSNIVPLRYLGTAVCKAVILELGPVLTALVIAARVGASIAAEIGTMKTNEQIDAMECLALDPLRYLVMPRIIAATIMMPAMVIVADFVALLGSWVVAVMFMGVTPHLYSNGLKIFFNPRDVYVGLIKAAAFGAIIALMGCYHGLRAKGGAHGVGQATTKAVISAMVLILIFDYVIASLLF